MSKILVLYVFHIFNERCRYFIKNGIFYDPNVDFIIISNDKYTDFKAPPYVKKFFRDNIGYDFGGWSDALLTDKLYEKYDYFIFLNSSVMGPFVNGRWTDIYLNGLKGNVKLFGSTINCTMRNTPLIDWLNLIVDKKNILFEVLYNTTELVKFLKVSLGDPNDSAHLQSYIFAMDRNTLDYLIQCKIFTNTIYPKSFIESVNTKEILMSRKIIDKGWNIGCLLPNYNNVDFTHPNKNFNSLGDITLQKYEDILWTKEQLVFVKGNRSSNIEYQQLLILCIFLILFLVLTKKFYRLLISISKPKS
jgi:hypothetical protein